MGNLFMIGNYKNKRNELTNNYNRNDKTQLFTGITKKSPTKIISIMQCNEHRHSDRTNR